jgi:hypothetical protein
MSLFINIFNRKRREKLLEYILLIKKLKFVYLSSNKLIESVFENLKEKN